MPVGKHKQPNPSCQCYTTIKRPLNLTGHKTTG